ncbi:hypothetical protein EPIB2_672 [Tritonibacter mobilis]|nr:hypothetical protein EPIB2_672 [Tritonibacter mobilis]
MKAARGEGFNPARLRPQHLIEGPAPSPEPTDMVLERVGNRVREIMHERGIQPHRRHAA